MKPAYSDNFCTLYTGTALDVLRQMPAQSVHMCVTSPPYWGLRSYLPKGHSAKGQEIGTERTPDEYVAKLVAVFAEVWRVLRDDGTLWVNIGDSYVGYWGDKKAKAEGRPSAADGKGFSMNSRPKFDEFRHTGLKPKDLCMIPARLAIALQSWGWYLRQELVWAKDSCMPESVRDRCTRAHEFVYMLTKKPRYFYDGEAIKEAGSENKPWAASSNGGDKAALIRQDGNPERLGVPASATRNARSVWRINPKPYPGSHFAVFPPELPMRCIKAGTSERGVCTECGAPWRRVVQSGRVWTAKDAGQTNKDSHLAPQGPAHTGNSRAGNVEARTIGWEPTCTHFDEAEYDGKLNATDEQAAGRRMLKSMKRARDDGGPHDNPFPPKRTVGWEASCGHGAKVVPATVLDPFAGSGTTLYAARKLGRRSIGIDLDERSPKLLEERLGQQQVLL